MTTDNVSTVLATAREARRRDQAAAPKAAKPAARKAAKSDAPKAAAKPKAARPSAVASLMDKFLATVADKTFEVEATAKKLGVAPKMVRNCIDQLRRKGGKAAVANVGKGTFQLAAK